MAVPGVGIDKLVEMGKLDRLKNGPIFWMDSADSNPRIGKTLCSSHYCKSVGLQSSAQASRSLFIKM